MKPNLQGVVQPMGGLRLGRKPGNRPRPNLNSTVGQGRAVTSGSHRALSREQVELDPLSVLGSTTQKTLPPSQPTSRMEKKPSASTSGVSSGSVSAASLFQRSQRTAAPAARNISNPLMNNPSPPQPKPIQRLPAQINHNQQQQQQQQPRQHPNPPPPLPPTQQLLPQKSALSRATSEEIARTFLVNAGPSPTAKGTTLGALRQYAREGIWDKSLNLAEQLLLKLQNEGTRGAAALLMWCELKTYQTRALVQLGRATAAQQVLTATEDSFVKDLEKAESDEGIANPTGSIVPLGATDDPANVFGKSGRGLQLPFTLWVIHAEVPHVLGDTTKTRQRLAAVLRRLDQEEKFGPPAPLADQADVPHCALSLVQMCRETRWLARVELLGLIASYAAATGDFDHAIDSCAEMEFMADCVEKRSENISQKVIETLRVHALCRASRILVLMGNIHAAQRLHSRLQSFLSKSSSLSPMLRFERATLAVAQGRYAVALSELESICEQEAHRILDEGPGVFPDLPGGGGGASEHVVGLGTIFPSSLLVASNNLAVCALHCCQIERAVTCLEEFIKKDPRRRLHPAILFNLCTLYDLAFDSEGSRRRKRALQIVVKKLGRQSIKLPTPGFSLSAGQLQRLGLQ